MKSLFFVILWFCVAVTGGSFVQQEPKKVTLQAMTDESFKDFKEKIIERFVENVAKNDRDPPEQVRKKEIAEFQHVLPLKHKTPNHFIFDVIAQDSGKQVGTIWLLKTTQDDETELFLYDIYIFEEFQNQGYGTALLRTYEQKAKEMGAQKLGLHVFGHNKGALKLYTKEEFFLTGYNLAKNL
jgi:ribosomal protein S18 acetylase RimI-like enzyme